MVIRERWFELVPWSRGRLQIKWSLAGLLLAAILLAPAPRTALAGERWFLRGDVDNDGALGLADPIGILEFLFVRGSSLSCLDAADVDDNGSVQLTDPVLLLAHLFNGGRIRPPTQCGPDPSHDGLSCDGPTFCAPEFFGLELADDVDGIFYLVDRSGSMQNSGELDFVQREIECTISSLTADMQFGVVFFDRSVLQFPASGMPARATDEVKQSAVSWVNSVQGGGGSCVLDGLVAALDMVRRSDASRKVLVYLGDGGGTCNGSFERLYLDDTLRAARERTDENTVIHTVGVLQIGVIQADFLSKLAADSGGTFVRLEH